MLLKIFKLKINFSILINNMDFKIRHILTTKRGKRCIVIELYKYTESNKLQDRTFLFRCTNEKI